MNFFTVYFQEEYMNLTEIDNSTEDIFFRCLHSEIPADGRILELRHRWYDKNKKNGLRAKVLKDDNDEIIGMCQYIPIEYSHLSGNDLFAILCVDVNGPAEDGFSPNAGNQQKKGYGRYILECIEKDAKESGANGVAAWGMDFPFWNPISFYEHMGYSRTDKNGNYVLAWKPFSSKAIPPKLMRLNYKTENKQDKINITALVNGWCGAGCENCIAARDAIEGLENEINYKEIDTSDRDNLNKYGIDDALIIDGDIYTKETHPWNSSNLRQELLKKIQYR
jgi:hypothetical protein